MLAGMTDDVAALVLRDNYFQTQVLSVTRHIASRLLDAQQRFIQFLEKAGRLRRKLEFLPSDDEFAERRTRGQGLTSPEHAVLLAFSKIWLNDELLASPLLDDPWVASTLKRYFPKALRERFASYMARHPLKREIIATHVTNSMLNRVGSTFVHRVMETTGAKPHEIVRAFLLTREIFGFVSLWKAIEALDNRVDDAVQAAMLIDAGRLIDRGTMWFLRSRRLTEDMAATIAHFQPRVEALAARLPELLDAGDRARVRSAIAEYQSRQVPESLATRMVALDALYSTLDIVEVAGTTRRPVELVAEIYFELSTRLGLPWLRERIALLPGEQHWPMLAKGAMHDDLSGLQRAIASEALTAGGGTAARRGTDRGMAGAQSPRHRAAAAAARRTALGTGGRRRDARGCAARVAQSRVMPGGVAALPVALGDRHGSGSQCARHALVGDERIGEPVGSRRRSRLARRFAPLAARQRRKPGVAGEFAGDFRQLNGRCTRQRRPIQLATADAERRRREAHERDGRIERPGDLGVPCHIALLAGHHDVLPARQRTRERLPGLAAHDHGVTLRQCAKVPQILGQPPRQPVIGADHAIGGDGGDQHKRKGARGVGSGTGDECILPGWRRERPLRCHNCRRL